MSFLDPRAPLVVGTLCILGYAAYLAVRHPAPGPLSSAHGEISGLSVLAGCARCHDEAGLDAGCLSCHEEIGIQLAIRTGYHAWLLADHDTSCSTCHLEHLGPTYPLTSARAWHDSGPTGFTHPHVAFTLVGRHTTLECAECHAASLRPPWTLPGFTDRARTTTYLGLSQDCIACHEDIHAGGLSRDCQSCHGQERFRPADHFDHSRSYPLQNGHAGVACRGCHPLPEPSPNALATALPFDRVRGHTCAECHETPHRTPWRSDCTTCHAEDATPWSLGAAGVTPQAHARTSFPLAPPHSDTPCRGCHAPNTPYAVRYSDPRAPGYARRPDDCHGCHDDVHDGQFAGRYARCVDCHDRAHFLPATFELAQHTSFPLTGAHGKVLCQFCHRPSGPSSVTPAPPPATSAADGRTASEGGGGGEVKPTSRAEGERTPRRVRRFVGTPRECKSCHRDPHGDQFAVELKAGDCSTCHGDRAESFAIRPFDHERQTGYPLTGGHAGADCAGCHRTERPQPAPATGEPAKPVRVYRGTSTKCAACHNDVHLGQFRGKDGVLCDRCHVSMESWERIEFDHNKQSRFSLEGQHSRLACGECHPVLEVPATLVPWKTSEKTIRVVQYRPLGSECEDCHAFIKR